MQYLNMFLTFVNSNVKSVNLFGYIQKLYYFCDVKKYIKNPIAHLIKQWEQIKQQLKL